jgi:hypothetical protein
LLIGRNVSMIAPDTKPRFLAAGAVMLSLLAARQAAATTIFSDLFESGTSSWTTATGTVTTGSDAKIATGAALKMSPSGNFGFASKTFTATTLANVGDSLSFSFDLDFTAAPAASGSGLRFSLQSTTVPGSYVFQEGTGGTAGAAFSYFPTAAESGTGATALTTTGAAGSINDQNAHTLSLTVTRAAGGVNLSASVDGTPYAASDTSATFLTTFDRVAIGEGAMQVTYNFDNANLVAAPEPATAALFVVAPLGLLSRRRRGMRQ